MRKTHQSALALKQALVQELQDIVAERDETINHLKAQLRNGQVQLHCDINIKSHVNESQVI